MLAISALEALRCRFVLLRHVSTERCLLSFPARLDDALFFFGSLPRCVKHLKEQHAVMCSIFVFLRWMCSRNMRFP